MVWMLRLLIGPQGVQAGRLKAVMSGLEILGFRTFPEWHKIRHSGPDFK